MDAVIAVIAITLGTYQLYQLTVRLTEQRASKRLQPVMYVLIYGACVLSAMSVFGWSLPAAEPDCFAASCAGHMAIFDHYQARNGYLLASFGLFVIALVRLTTLNLNLEFGRKFTKRLMAG